jgi:hypothetical protein
VTQSVAQVTACQLLTLEQVFLAVVGTAFICQLDGCVLRLEDSLFVPGLSCNLLSLTKLIKQSALIQQEDQNTRITIDDSISFICHHYNNILEVVGKIGPLSREIFALITSTHSTAISTFKTWHCWLGHAGISRIKSVLPGITLEKTGSFDTCMKGKVACIPYNGHFDVTHHPLEVVHADLVGPITPLTNLGTWYFLMLVNQHTGFISVTLVNPLLQLGFTWISQLSFNPYLVHLLLIQTGSVETDPHFSL